jgi:hypothetical protein
MLEVMKNEISDFECPYKWVIEHQTIFILGHNNKCKRIKHLYVYGKRVLVECIS